MNPEIFKPYDIRGIYPDEINEEAAYKIGRAFIKHLKAKKITVGRDVRPSSPQLAKNLIQGVIDEGCDVVNIGLSTSPMLYFAVAKNKLDGGVMVTASHNPKEYNGLKLTEKNALPVASDSGLEKIKQISLKNSFKDLNKKGKITEKNILNDYIENAFKAIKIKNLKKLKIVVDAGNGMAGLVLPHFFKKLNCQVIPLFWELNGSFPNHAPNPLLEENLKILLDKIKQEKADLGIALDGDGDRIVFVNEKGEPVRGDLITALIAEEVLKSNPGGKIIATANSSRVIREIAEKNNGRFLVSRVGHSFIKKEMMRDNKAVFAGEVSGHYYLKSNYNIESPFIIILYLLNIISKENEPISEIMKPFEKYCSSGEINFEVSNKEAVIKKIGKHYKNGKISYLDGITVEYKDWWFNLRPSNTESLLRFTLEADSEELMKSKLKEVREKLSCHSELSFPPPYSRG